MPAARQPLVMDRRGTFEETFQWTDDTTGLPVPITPTYSALLLVYDGLDGNVLLTLTSDVDGGIEIEPGGATGALYVKATDAASDPILRTCMYLLQLVPVDGSGAVDLAYGPIRLGARGPRNAAWR